MIWFISFSCRNHDGCGRIGSYAVRHRDLLSAWSLLHAKVLLEARMSGQRWSGCSDFRLFGSCRVRALEAFRLCQYAWSSKDKDPLRWEMISHEPSDISVNE